MNFSKTGSATLVFRNEKGKSEQEINVMATQQIDERELLISKFESELATLQRNQFSEFRQVG